MKLNSTTACRSQDISHLRIAKYKDILPERIRSIPQTARKGVDFLVSDISAKQASVYFHVNRMYTNDKSSVMATVQLDALMTSMITASKI